MFDEDSLFFLQLSSAAHDWPAPRPQGTATRHFGPSPVGALLRLGSLTSGLGSGLGQGYRENMLK